MFFEMNHFIVISSANFIDLHKVKETEHTVEKMIDYHL